VAFVVPVASLETADRAAERPARPRNGRTAGRTLIQRSPEGDAMFVPLQVGGAVLPVVALLFHVIAVVAV
jgi:hypothetical protein